MTLKLLLPDGTLSGGLATSDGALLVSLETIGSTDDEPWDGVSDDATVISLLKKIALNTEPVA